VTNEISTRTDMTLNVISSNRSGTSGSLFCVTQRGNLKIIPLYLQDAQLSQRDRAARCVIVFAKSRTLELGDDDLLTL